jgi:hypothetical protein
MMAMVTLAIVSASMLIVSALLAHDAKQDRAAAEAARFEAEVLYHLDQETTT